MAAPFAAFETATATAAVAALANATATLPGGGTAEVIFDNAHASAFGLVGGTSPSCIGKTSDLTGVAVGGTVTIGGTGYTVVGNEPDGTGITRLDLEKP